MFPLSPPTQRVPCRCKPVVLLALPMGPWPSSSQWAEKFNVVVSWMASTTESGPAEIRAKVPFRWASKIVSSVSSGRASKPWNALASDQRPVHSGMDTPGLLIID